MTAEKRSQTAGEAGWHISRYNLSLDLPEKKRRVIVNLFDGSCAEYSPLETYLMSVLDEISADHPIIERLAKRGVIANFDELTALDALGRMGCCSSQSVDLTICPTMGCNFNCPYCFENHYPGKMQNEVQNDVAELADRMMRANHAESLMVTWFGGEPLMAPEIIESLSAKLIALADKYQAKYKAGIITNGYLLTPENIQILENARVSIAQITLDGIGAAHDATRHLVNGDPTFERIVSNLRRPIPFKVSIRHNIHEGNRNEGDKLKSFIYNLAKDSGNNLEYYPAPVSGTYTAEERGTQLDLLGENDLCMLGMQRDVRQFTPGNGTYCGVHDFWTVCIDEKGRLNKCWENVDKPELCFGNAHDWDPMDPIRTASKPDNLTMFLNSADPLNDQECRNCIWLPTCKGGCPYQRLFRKRSCVPYRNDPEAYVREMHKHLVEKTAAKSL